MSFSSYLEIPWIECMQLNVFVLKNRLQIRYCDVSIQGLRVKDPLSSTQLTSDYVLSGKIGVVSWQIIQSFVITI